MPYLILLILIAVPYLEFLVFMEVGNTIGGASALLLTILTAVIGVYLIRQQGLVVMNRMHRTLQAGESPVEDIVHGFFLLIAGLFFLLPGFITDTLALALAFAPARALLGRFFILNIRASFYKNRHRSQNSPYYEEENTIDGEYEDKPQSVKNIDHDDKQP